MWLKYSYSTEICPHDSVSIFSFLCKRIAAIVEVACFGFIILHPRRTHYRHIKSHENRQIQNFLKLGVLIPSVLVCIEVWRDDFINNTEFICNIISIVVVWRVSFSMLGMRRRWRWQMCVAETCRVQAILIAFTENIKYRATSRVNSDWKCNISENLSVFTKKFCRFR